MLYEQFLKKIPHDSESTEENIESLYILTMWPFWPYPRA